MWGYIYKARLEAIEVGSILSAGENLVATLSDEDHVFELGRVSTIGGSGGPVIGPSHVLPVTVINHRLDRENVAYFHHSNRLIVTIVRHVRRTVEQVSYTMSTVALNDREALFMGVL